MKTIFLIVFGWLTINLCWSQVVLNNNRSSIRWMEMKTPHFRVLFPDGFEDQAQNVAATLNNIYEPAAKTLGAKPKPISIVLQNRSSLSNAFVSIAPRRSEFYTMPSPDYRFIGNVDWMDLIAVHEYRHIVQFQQSLQGLTKWTYYLLGSNGLSAMANIAVPQWFWEGDAVAIETILTSGGRGNIPHFGLIYRTNLLEKRNFSYEKQILGSYKHQVPNHYTFGYHMVSYLRKYTGDPHIWGKITSRAWKNPFIPFAFSQAIKKEAGLSLRKLEKKMAVDLGQHWKQTASTLNLTSFDVLTETPRKSYTDYEYPQLLNDGGVVVMKSGLGDISQFVRIGGYKDKKVFVPGFVNDGGMISLQNNKLAWVEFNYHPRHLVENYSVIKVFDIDTDELVTLGKQQRYLSVALSPSGDRVIAVESNRDYQHAMVLLDVKTGAVLKKFVNPKNDILFMPRWTLSGDEIVYLRTRDGKKQVSLLEWKTGKVVDLLSDVENIGYPVIYKEYLLYNSPRTGIDNIFAYHLEKKETYQVTSSQYGAYNPVISADGTTLYYNEQGRNGMGVVSTPFDPSTWVRVNEQTQPAQLLLASAIRKQEPRPEGLFDQENHSYPTTKYNQAKGLVNPYTWGVYFDDSYTTPGFGFSSRDLLGTLAWSAGYSYDPYEHKGSYGTVLSYQKFFPILDVGYSYGQRDVNERAYGRKVNFTWDENRFSGTLRVPLQLTRSKYRTSLSIANAWEAVFTRKFQSLTTSGDTLSFFGFERNVPALRDDENEDLYHVFNRYTDQGMLLANHFSLTFTHYLKQSIRDFNPAFGQSLGVDLFNTPYGGDYIGWQASFRGALYFPGVIKHHSLFFRVNYQYAYDGGLTTDFLNVYTFANRIFKPRGFSYPNHQEFMTLSANYRFPLWYPDFRIGPLLNIQRIRVNTFFDYGEGVGNDYLYYANPLDPVLVVNRDKKYYSAGVEATADFNLFRLPPKFEMGLRASFLASDPTRKTPVYEFLIGSIGF